MRCPTLDDLPPAPEGKTGWPWTEASPSLSERMPTGKLWPTISIVTPSFNQGAFIEETIRSILLQGYPNLEYIVIDGGSTDCTVEIIRKYERWISYWVSEADFGQAHAINKALKKANGDIFHWINSDDVLLPKALEVIGSSFKPEGACLFCVENLSTDGMVIFKHRPFHANEISDPGRLVPFHQPGMILPRSVYEKLGGVPEDLHFSFDSVLFFYAANQIKDWIIHDDCIVRFRVHPLSKSSNSTRYVAEKSLFFYKMLQLSENDVQKVNFRFKQKVAIEQGRGGAWSIATLLWLYLLGSVRYRSYRYHRNMWGSLR